MRERREEGGAGGGGSGGGLRSEQVEERRLQLQRQPRVALRLDQEQRLLSSQYAVSGGRYVLSGKLHV